MMRYYFRQGRPYAARLLRVSGRSIENDPSLGLRLLRLEFEIFVFVETQQHLISTGKVACRDLVLGSAVDVSRDACLVAYCSALRVADPTNVAEWLKLATQARWLTVEFGGIDEIDQRNAFHAIQCFDHRGWTVREHDYDLDQDWVSVQMAAKQLKCSESTIRRRVAEFESDWGTHLVARTPGNHRRIHFPLLRNLWET